MLHKGEIRKINLSIQLIGKLFPVFISNLAFENRKYKEHSSLNMHFVWSNHLDLHLLSIWWGYCRYLWIHLA